MSPAVKIQGYVAASSQATAGGAPAGAASSKDTGRQAAGSSKKTQRRRRQKPKGGRGNAAPAADADPPPLTQEDIVEFGREFLPYRVRFPQGTLGLRLEHVEPNIRVKGFAEIEGPDGQKSQGPAAGKGHIQLGHWLVGVNDMKFEGKVNSREVLQGVYQAIRAAKDQRVLQFKPMLGTKGVEKARAAAAAGIAARMRQEAGGGEDDYDHDEEEEEEEEEDDDDDDDDDDQEQEEEQEDSRVAAHRAQRRQQQADRKAAKAAADAAMAAATQERPLVTRHGGRRRPTLHHVLPHAVVQPPVRSLWLLDLRHVAEQWTLIESDLFRRIPSHEFLAVDWEKPRHSARGARSMALRAVKDRFNGVASWITALVLHGDSPRERASYVAWFVDLAAAMLSLRNLHGVFQIVSALKSHAIQKLAETQAAVSSHHRTRLDRLGSIVNITSNFKDYRAALGTALRDSARAAQQQQIPGGGGGDDGIVPALAVHQRDLFAAEGTQTKVGRSGNDDGGGDDSGANSLLW